MVPRSRRAAARTVVPVERRPAPLLPGVGDPARRAARGAAKTTVPAIAVRDSRRRAAVLRDDALRVGRPCRRNVGRRQAGRWAGVYDNAAYCLAVLRVSAHR